MLAALLQAGSLGVDLAKGKAKAEVRHVVRQVAVGAATGCCSSLLAFSFGLAAFTVWLAREIGVVPALGFIGLGFLVVAALIVGIAAAADKRRKTHPAAAPSSSAVRQEFVAAEAAAASGASPARPSAQWGSWPWSPTFSPARFRRK